MSEKPRNKQDLLTIVSNVETMEFFPNATHSNNNLSDLWVPITYTLPFRIVPRDTYKKDVIRTKQEMIDFYISEGYTLVNGENSF